MSINPVDVLLSLIWAAAFGITGASAFIWRMERHRRRELYRERMEHQQRLDLQEYLADRSAQGMK